MSTYYSFSFYLFFFFVLVKSDERQILLNLKTSLQKSNSNVFTSWNTNTSNSVCNFVGMNCNITDGSVTKIDLSNRQLSGRFPFDSICQLQGLKKLSPGSNYLYGFVSDDLNNCGKLKYLDLGNNRFTGVFPNVSGLSQLQHLYLNIGDFSGSFPWNSLANMSDLATLSIGDNPFDSSEFLKEVLNLKNLNWVYLANCSIQGKIPPEIGNLFESSTQTVCRENFQSD